MLPISNRLFGSGQLLLRCLPLSIMVIIFSQFSCVVAKDKQLRTKSIQRDNQVQKTQRQKMIEYARYFLEKPYKRNGRDESGFDCSGFVCYVMKNFDIHLPLSSAEISMEGLTIQAEDVQAGDLIIFGDKNRIHHVGIITEHTAKSLKVIHSSSSMGVIEENVLKSDYWLKRIRMFKNIESYKSSNKLAAKRR